MLTSTRGVHPTSGPTMHRPLWTLRRSPYSVICGGLLFINGVGLSNVKRSWKPAGNEMAIRSNATANVGASKGLARVFVIRFAETVRNPCQGSTSRRVKSTGSWT